MIIQRKSDLQGGPRDASGPGWRSLRMLTKTERMGFSLNETWITAGASMTLEYKHHLEACYCISGRGIVTDLATGADHVIEAGTLYALDQNDRHTLRVTGDEDMLLISVFNPALTGDEVHGADGSYSA
jgi:L-ectoine synthase